MAEGAPTLAWSIPNLITVTLMVLIVFAAVGFVARAFRAARGGTMPSPAAGVDQGS